MDKVAIYCRLSEEDRNKLSPIDSNSIQNQKRMLLQYAQEQNWEVYQIYSDDDYTGADRNRPAFQQLLRDAEARKFQIILCKTQSRFTRELELVETYLHGQFPQWGIRFVGLVDHADTTNQGNKKARQINGLVNEWYLEDMSENIRSVLNHRRQNGLHIGSFALYGYQKDPEQKGHLLIDPEAAVIVREIFTRFSQGYGKTAIAKELNARGVPNPSHYKRQKGLHYQSGNNGTLWKYATIASILRNEIYIGNMVQGKYGSLSYKSKKNHPRPPESWYIVQNTHEAIIPLPLWEQVQKQLQERRKPCADGSLGVFAYKIRCAGCGYGMKSTKSRGRRYLQCGTHQLSPADCVGACIAVAQLEKTVLQELNQLAARYLQDTVLQQQRYQKQLEEYETALQSLYLDKTKGLLSEAEFITLHQRFTEKRQKIEQMFSPLPFSKLTRSMVETWIAFIEIGKREPQGIPVTIHWNF